MRTRSFLLCTFLLLIAPLAIAEEAVSIRDGKLFDEGAERTGPAEGAPEDLKHLAPFVGEWDLEMEVHRPASPGNPAQVLRSKGRARVTWMNRGHALMERTRIADFDGAGHTMATLTFLAVDDNGLWTASEGNSWTEAIAIASGSRKGDRWVLHDAMRPGGGGRLLYLRRTYQKVDDNRFEMRFEASSDRGETWTMAVVRRFTRRAPVESYFPVRQDVGEAAPGLPPEATQFDFLLGEWDASHWMKVQDREIRFQATATGVRALDGHAILEHGFHNSDPSLPDAATTILRIYNRSMRRWESLFLTNRSNVPLHFGGVQEGQRIVLHPFAAQTGGNPLNQWIFFDPKKDSYRWQGLRSTDRGKTFEPYWTIEFARRKAAEEG
ncbi:MAG: hypothetical protein AAF481_16390 [Acidobacteriota bacterium]